jgi:murein L,D-transpeptidase YafK
MLRKLAAIGLLMLTGCATVIPDNGRNPLRAAVPQTSELKSLNVKAEVADHSPVLLRIFKEERELELWKQQPTGKFVLVARFEICSVSGGLGPKIKQGDRQAPEGFYDIHPRQMNPNSAEWLSFNTGYPNKYDRAHRRTGSALMVHGGCSSAGCYAIKDGPMQDLYAAMRDAFTHGQRNIQLQIYPFRMSDSNMMSHRDPHHRDFWQQLKVGYDQFETTHQPLRVSVIKKRYVIDKR